MEERKNPFSCFTPCLICHLATYLKLIGKSPSRGTLATYLLLNPKSSYDQFIDILNSGHASLYCQTLGCTYLMTYKVRNLWTCWGFNNPVRLESWRPTLQEWERVGPVTRHAKSIGGVVLGGFLFGAVSEEQ